MKVTVTATSDLSLPLAKRIAETASATRADVRLLYKDKGANAKSLMGIISLSYKKGSVLTLVALGKDEEKAVESIRALL
ncbi:MAG: HPr family phosphocarrier protein [Clostridia bacterium]|nr:HPr family phosphocarrier protein [Clostridia bacterium]